jgi:hypothetical protein
MSGAWVPALFTWSTAKPDHHSNLTLEYILRPPDNSASLYHYVQHMFFTYQTVDEPQDLFKRLEQVVIQQNNRVLHRLTSNVWSTFLVLENKNFIKNRKESKLYIPLTNHGIVDDITASPVTVSVTFRNYQKEHERVGLFVQYSTHAPSAPVSERYWTLSNPIYVKMPQNVEEKTMNVVLPWIGANTTVGQLVFHIPGANNWIKSGCLKAVSTDIESSGNDEIVVYEFKDPYEPVVIDKLFFDMPLPKSSLLTLTFANWQKVSADEGLRTSQDRAFVLHLDLDDNMPVDNRPKDASLEIFAVIGLPR